MVGTLRPRDFLVKFGTGMGIGEEEIELFEGGERDFFVEFAIGMGMGEEGMGEGEMEVEAGCESQPSRSSSGISMVYRGGTET